jgi:hypothetical protein
MAICCTIYQVLFWREMGIDTDSWIFDPVLLDEVLPGEHSDAVDPELVYAEYQRFLAIEKTELDPLIDPYMSEAKKTFDVVQAVLYTFMLEKSLVPSGEISQTGGTMVGKYIKLTQDLIAGGNTGLVHAILSKMYPPDHDSLPPEQV